MANLIVEWGFIIALALFIGKSGQQLFNWVMSKRIVGQANEWVVVMNGGVQNKAEIGLSTLLSPFDQVGIFPSALNKVEVNTQQVT